MFLPSFVALPGRLAALIDPHVQKRRRFGAWTRSMKTLKSVSLYSSSENRTFFGETRTPPLRPQMTSSLHTRDRDPPNLFTARNGTHSSVGSPSTAHLCRKDTAQTLRFQSFRHTGRAARGHSTVFIHLSYVHIPRAFNCTSLRSAPIPLTEGRRP